MKLTLLVLFSFILSIANGCPLPAGLTHHPALPLPTGLTRPPTPAPVVQTKMTPGSLCQLHDTQQQDLSNSLGHSSIASDCSVTAKVGETVILPLSPSLPQGSKLPELSITWKTETGEIVHQYQNGKGYGGKQLKRFQGRTCLLEIEKGDVSLKIINVTKEDEGNYTCVVLHKDPDIDKTYKVSLYVTEKGGNKQDRDLTQSTETEHEHVLTQGQIAGIVIGVIIVLAAPAALIFLYRRCN